MRGIVFARYFAQLSATHPTDVSWEAIVARPLYNRDGVVPDTGFFMEASPLTRQPPPEVFTPKILELYAALFQVGFTSLPANVVGSLICANFQRYGWNVQTTCR